MHNFYPNITLDCNQPRRIIGHHIEIKDSFIYREREREIERKRGLLVHFIVLYKFTAVTECDKNLSIIISYDGT